MGAIIRPCLLEDPLSILVSIEGARLLRVDGAELLGERRRYVNFSVWGAHAIRVYTPCVLSTKRQAKLRLQLSPSFSFLKLEKCPEFRCGIIKKVIYTYSTRRGPDAPIVITGPLKWKREMEKIE